MECRQTLPWMGREQCGGDLSLEGTWKWSFHAGESSQHLIPNRRSCQPGDRAVSRSAGTQEGLSCQENTGKVTREPVMTKNLEVWTQILSGAQGHRGAPTVKRWYLLMTW